MKILNKVALVTGGAEGIGKALCQRLLEHGTKLVAILDINADWETTATDFLKSLAVTKFDLFIVTCQTKLNYASVVFNLKILGTCESFQEAFDVHGQLDIVVNNAGLIAKDNRKTIEILLLAVINGCLIAEELMTKEPRPEKGIIVNTSSIAGMVVQDTNILNSSYFAAKHGVVAFTKSLPASADNFSKDLRVVAICPGLVLTNIFKKQDVVDDNVMTKELDDIKEHVTNVSVVVDAFILAIEDESLHGDIITAFGSEGIKVVT
ncbi:putative 15-hydroxyprostaglandin dehydrogenase [Apostichopus japonicus]|uniref:15-hydroxyprostaglandin dehydrogenase [NAD(+)] n=1 Tax=Stichopus japonicus TaxID=307972 RepID=A0A2G8JY75_STIJA|nr:putative 15-hydroxyprostaglandin dehydrogenase [Apostichopus japonicus]